MEVQLHVLTKMSCCYEAFILNATTGLLQLYKAANITTSDFTLAK
jgi:hypothetical protein